MARPKLPNIIPDAINPIRQMRIVGRLVRRAVKKPGTAPGTLVHTGTKKVERVRIHCIDFAGSRVEESESLDVGSCVGFRDSPGVSWVNVEGLHDVEVVRTLGDAFGWHPLLLEDIVGVGQRAKVEEHAGYVFVVLPMLSWDPERRQVEEEQVSLFLGDRYVFTFQERAGDVFDPVRERLRQGFGRIRSRGADYLAYALVDAVVDHYFVVLAHLGDVLESLEEEVMNGPDQGTMFRLHEVKRELAAMRRAIWPVRDAVAALTRDEDERFTAETRIFLKDVHDHVVQVAESLDSLRDVASGEVDLYLSMVGHRTNEVMRVLTVMASIFIPLTFFAGIWGMNFEFMPELGIPWAYPAVLAAMAGMAVGMVIYFRRRGWL